MKKKFFAIILALAVVMSCAGGAMADYDLTAASNSTTETEISPRRPFVREYTKYFIMYTQITVMQDGNWDMWGDDTITVAFSATQGPTRMYVEVMYREDGTSSWSSFAPVYLNLNQSKNYDIPAGHEFLILATACAGQSGDATFQISLS